MSAIATALLSMLGAAIGAFMHNHFAKRNNVHRQLLEWRNKAYVDFLESVSLAIAAQRINNKKQEVEQLARLTDAKSRICIYGDESVIKSLARFWSSGATLETESEILAYTNLCLGIRKSLGMKDKSLLIPEVSQLLFNISTIKI